MRNLFLASTCTLVLSLTGAFGSNQNSMNFDYNLNKDTAVNAVNIEEQQSLPIDNQMRITDTVTKTPVTVTNLTTPQEENLKASDTLKADNHETGVKAATYFSPSFHQANTKVILYKNVDLSKCKSVNDVVKTLRRHGFINITKKNINQIKSLQSVLRMVKANAASVKTTAAPVTVTPAAIKNQTTAPTAAPVKTPTAAPVKTPSVAPTKTPTVAPAQTASTGISSYASEVLRLINIERAKAGVSALTTNTTLAKAANKRAQETVTSFSHTRPNGTGFSTVLTDYAVSFNAAGENIAYGQRSPQEVVTAWMNSPGHRANILNASFHKVGIGVYQTGSTIYWTQEFTN